MPGNTSPAAQGMHPVQGPPTSPPRAAGLHRLLPSRSAPGPGLHPQLLPASRLRRGSFSPVSLPSSQAGLSLQHRGGRLPAQGRGGKGCSWARSNPRAALGSPLGFFFPNSVLVTLASRLLAGLGGVSSGAIMQLLGGSLSGVYAWGAGAGVRGWTEPTITPDPATSHPQHQALPCPQRPGLSGGERQ